MITFTELEMTFDVAHKKYQHIEQSLQIVVNFYVAIQLSGLLHIISFYSWYVVLKFGKVFILYNVKENNKYPEIYFYQICFWPQCKFYRINFKSNCWIHV